MSVSQSTSLPPHVVRDVTGFARALVTAVRTRQMYAADHPAAHAATERLWSATGALTAHPDLHIGVSPANLLANGELMPADRRVVEAAALLHDRDILRLRVVVSPSQHALADFLQLLSFESDAVRQRGGPAQLWQDFGHRSLELDQIDYEAILAAPEGPSARSGARDGPDPAGAKGRAQGQPRDGVWDSLVKSMSDKATPYSRGARERLRQISQSADDIFDFAIEAAQVQNPAAIANRQAAQAATVLTAFERLVSQIEATAPDQVTETIRNIAAAASRMDPLLVMDAVAESAESGLGGPVARALGDSFDDNEVARLLATSMAREGRASGRMAAALNTLAPDAERQRRVLRLASQMTDVPGAGPHSEVASAWTALEQILTGPADTLYTSADYAFQLQEAELRSHRLRLQAPEHLEKWVASVSAESMRTLSVSLLLDLFALEEVSCRDRRSCL